MFELNKKIISLEPYEPLKGSYPIRLDANESFYPLPTGLRHELAKIARDLDYNRYPDPMNTEPIAAFGALFDLKRENISAGNGSDELISVIITAFMENGDNILVCDPDFSMYRFYAYTGGYEITGLPKTDFRIDVDEIIKNIEIKNPRMVIFSNPCNPTGQGFSLEEVRSLAEKCRENNSLLVVDEAYMDFWDQSFLKEVCNYNNVLVLKTCSKILGLAALRMGFAAGDAGLVKVINSVKSPYNVNSFTQKAVAAVLKDKNYILRASNAFRRSVSHLENILNKFNKSVIFEVQKTKANFIVVKSSKAKEIYDKLLERGVAVRCFNGFLRITAGTIEENESLGRELEEILKGI